MKKNIKFKFNLDIKNGKLNFDYDNSEECKQDESNKENGDDNNVTNNSDDTKNNSFFWKIKKKTNFITFCFIASLVGFCADLLSVIESIKELF